MKTKALSTFEDFSSLGKYEFFNIKTDEKKKSMYFSLKKDRKVLTWIAKPIDSLSRVDKNANTFFLIGGDGVQGIVFRKEEYRFRIVPLHHPIKAVPKSRRKFENWGKRRK